MELDSKALDLARRNIASFTDDGYDIAVELVHTDVTAMPLKKSNRSSGPSFDTVLMNPPFGNIDTVLIDS